MENPRRQYPNDRHTAPYGYTSKIYCQRAYWPHHPPTAPRPPRRHALHTRAKQKRLQLGALHRPYRNDRQITGLEPSSAFLFKSALYPCVIEFTVKKDGSAAKAAGGGGGPSDATPNTTGSSGAASAGGGTAETGLGGAATVSAAAAAAAGGGGGKDEGVAPAEGARVGGGDVGGTSWLGQAKPKESSYKVTASAVGGEGGREGVCCGATGREQSPTYRREERGD